MTLGASVAARAPHRLRHVYGLQNKVLTCLALRADVHPLAPMVGVRFRYESFSVLLFIYLFGAMFN
jgi:hypothetical protein